MSTAPPLLQSTSNPPNRCASLLAPVPLQRHDLHGIGETFQRILQPQQPRIDHTAPAGEFLLKHVQGQL